MLGDLGFENAYALAMPRKKADALGIKTIADLATHAPQMTIGGDYEFFDRPEWKAIREAYGLRFATGAPCRRHSCIRRRRTAIST